MNMYMNVRASPTDSDYRKCWHKAGDIRKPSPSKALVFIDEHEKSIQQSAFGINAPIGGGCSAREMDLDQFPRYPAQQWLLVHFRGWPCRNLAMARTEHSQNKQSQRLAGSSGRHITNFRPRPWPNVPGGPREGSDLLEISGNGLSLLSSSSSSRPSSFVLVSRSQVILKDEPSSSTCLPINLAQRIV